MLGVGLIILNRSKKDKRNIDAKPSVSMEVEGFKNLKGKIHAHLSHDRLKEAIAALFQMLAEYPKNDLEKRTIITAAAYKRLENAWIGQIVEWDTYAGGKNALIAEVYEIIEGIEQLNALPAGDSSYEEKHREVYERVKNLLRKLGERPETPMAVLLMALGLAASERITSSFTDPRDGRTYRTVQLVGKTWMAENLNYNVGVGCWFYDDDPKNGEKYGRLYTWEAAKRACPPGWRLPENEEWNSLANAFGGYYAPYSLYSLAFVRGKDLSQSYWALIEGGNSSFNALLGGYRRRTGKYLGLDRNGYYWSATEYVTGFSRYYYYFNGDYQRVVQNDYSRGLGLSCRCLKA